MLAQAFDLCLEVESEICPRRVNLEAQLPIELEHVLGPSLCKLVAHELIELRHDQPVEDVGHASGAQQTARSRRSPEQQPAGKQVAGANLLPSSRLGCLAHLLSAAPVWRLPLRTGF